MVRRRLPANICVLPGILALLCACSSGAAGEIPGDDQFGESLSLSGNTVIVGRPSNSTGSSTRDGAALVFVRRQGSWGFQARLGGADSTLAAGFGAAVALDGDTAAVAAPAGTMPRVYLFERQGDRWLRRAEIGSPEPGTGFGRAVALDGDTLLVGAQFRNASRGGAYVYERVANEWRLAGVLVAAAGSPDDRFGNSLALDGSRAVVGAVGEGFGSAYVFDRVGGTWQQTQRLQPSGGQPGDRFGLAVALDGDRAVIGAPGTESDDLEEQGAAVVFERGPTGWSQTAELSAFDGRENDLFGWSLSLDGNTLVAGAIFDTDTASVQGSAYSFTQVAGMWVSSSKLRASQPRPSDIFGNAVAVESDVLWVGAPGFQTHNPGTAYVFERIGPAWNSGERFVDPIVFEDQFESD